jgi:superfamily I DNA/RNA helicase
LLARLDNIFAPEAHADRDFVVLSSVHKAKGLERDRVWLLEESFRRSGGEEDNIRYVAITRAKRDLRLVDRAAVA